MSTSNTTFKAPVEKIEFELKPYITGQDTIDLESTGTGVSSVDGRTGEVKIDPEAAYKQRLRKLVDIVVVRAGEETSKQGIWDVLVGMRSSDYNLVMAKIETAANGGVLDEAEGKA
jgi:hypothetical protein